MRRIVAISIAITFAGQLRAQDISQFTQSTELLTGHVGPVTQPTSPNSGNNSFSQPPTSAFINADGTFFLNGRSGVACYRFPDTGKAYADQLIVLKKVAFTLTNGVKESGWMYKVKGEDFYFLFSDTAIHDPVLHVDVHRFYYSLNGANFLRWKTATGTRQFKFDDGESLAQIVGDVESKPDPTLPPPDSAGRDKMRQTLEDFLSKHLCAGNKGNAKVTKFDVQGGKVVFEVRLNHKHDYGVPVLPDISANTTVKAEFDPYDPASIKNTKLCTTVGGEVAKLIGQQELCITLADIAHLLLMS